MGAAELHFATSPRIMANLIYGKWPVEEAEASGEPVSSGDRDLAARFIDLFHLPAKAEVE